MDLNLTVLCGKLATDPDVRIFDSGSRLIRYLVTTRVETPRKRTDVIPVTLWDPTDEQVDNPGNPGDRVWACGSLQRRYWEGKNGRKSNIEVVAEQVEVQAKEMETL